MAMMKKKVCYNNENNTNITDRQSMSKIKIQRNRIVLRLKLRRRINRQKDLIMNINVNT